MPIVVKLDVMLAHRKMSLTELSEKLNISFPNMSILKTGKARSYRVSTIDNICRILECQPGDLFEYVTEEEYGRLMRK